MAVNVDLGAGVDVDSTGAAINVDLGAGIDVAPTRGQEFVSDIMGTPVLSTLAQGTAQLLQQPMIGKTLETAGTIADYFPALIRGMIQGSAKGDGLWGTLGQAALGFGKPLLSGPSSAPTGTEMAQQSKLPNVSASTFLPFLYSETGEGLPLKKGSYLDPTATDVAAAMFNLADPSLLTGGKLLQVPATTLATGAELGAMTGRGALRGAKTLLGDEKMMKAGAMTEPYLEKAESISALIKGGNVAESPIFQKQLRVIKSNGIDPELLPATVKYGPGSTIADYEKTIAEGLTPRAEELRARNAKFHNQTKAAIDKNITALSGAGYISKDFAAEKLRNNFTKNIRSKIAPLDTTYDSILNTYGDIVLSNNNRAGLNKYLDELESKNKGFLKNAPIHEKAFYKNRLNEIEAWRKSSQSYGDLLTSKRMLEEKAFKQDNVFSNQEYKNVVRLMRQSLVDAVPDGNVKKKLVDDNKAISEILDAQERLEGIVGDRGLSANDVFDKILTKGTPEQIRALKKIYPESDINEFRSVYLREGFDPLYKSWQGEGGQEVHTGYKQSRNFLLDKRNREKNSLLFKSGELKNLTDLANLGDRAGAPYMSSSRTRTQVSALGQAVSDFLSLTPESLRRRNLVEADIELAKKYGIGNPPVEGLMQRTPEPVKKTVKYAKPAVQQTGRFMNLYDLGYEEDQFQDRGR